MFEDVLFGLGFTSTVFCHVGTFSLVESVLSNYMYDEVSCSRTRQRAPGESPALY